MKKLFYAMLCALVLTACAKSEGALSPEESGRKAYLSLSIDVPVPNRVETRAISELESVVNELMLIMFDGSTKQVVNLTDSTTLISGTPDVATGYRTYTLAEAVPVASGNWNVYAVANWSSLFSNLTAEQLAAMSEAELKRTQMFNNEQYFQSGSRSLPMSSYAPGVVIYPADDAANSTSFKLSLRRAVSRVEFKFQNGTTSNNPNFQPETYAVYNLPKTAGLMHNIEGVSDVDLVQSTEYFNITNQSVPGSGVIEFMMLENVKTAKQTTGGDYKKRDKVNDAKTAFVYAPEHATFLRISGAYEDNDYRGTISFLIHLGDFGSSSSTDAAKMDNFAVNRNEHHIYNVTINGVNDLIVEAQKEGETPGVSGEITSKGSNLFVLDAHYETVMVKIPKSHIDGTHTYEQDGETVTMTNEVQIFSPKHPDGVTISLAGDTAPEEGDYGWIQFQKPENTTSFPIYGATSYGTIYDLCKNPETYALKVNEDGTDYYYSVAFVDEFFYDDLPLSDFVNVTNRVFILNPHPIHTSLDGESIFKADCTMQLNQRSIKSTYVLNDSSINPFGIETWDETGELEYGVDEYYSSETNRTDGWANTNSYGFRETGESAPLTSAGYLNSVTDNSKSSHIWTNAANFVNSVQAVYARNRDVDGSGVIEADELKWYMPALQQYLTLWLGQDLLFEDTKLITEEEVLAQTATEMDNAAKFFNSTFVDRIYWQDQGCCFGTWQGNIDVDVPRTENNVRCVRNLGAHGSSTHANNESVFQATPTFPATISTNSAGNYVISVSGVLNIRQTFFNGYYPVHTERSDYNLLPMNFEVAPYTNETDRYNVKSEGVGGLESADAVLEQLNGEADTYNTSVANAGTKWRVPNQRELMLMAILGVFPEYGSTWDHFGSSTFYSCYDKEGYETRAHSIFVYAITPSTSATFNLPGDDYGSVLLRFVRDVAVEQASSSVEEGEMPNGGTGFGIE